MKKINRAGKKLFFLNDIFLVILLCFVANNVLHKREYEINKTPIYADGRGYYEYLPALFIYNDITLTYLDTLESEFYTKESTIPIFTELKSGERLNKYFVGTALMQAPFFFIAHSIAKSSDNYVADGFSSIYQKWISYAAIFYLFLGMLCLRLLFQSYQVNNWWIFFCQLTILFATPLTHYVIYDAAYSHVYSFFLIALFLLLVRRYFQSNKGIFILFALLVFGLITIVRPINILVLLFTPLLTDSLRVYLSKVASIFKSHLKYFLMGFVLMGLIFSIQFYISYLQTGNSLNYNYGNEGFDFLNPNLYDFLFSYRKGFFLWTPIWFIIFIFALFILLVQKKYYHFTTFMVGFVLLVYVLSSWNAWSYGGSIGQRPMIDFYAAFSLLLIPISVNKLKFYSIVLLLLTPVFIYVMQIQTYQYLKAIILQDGMDKEKYWEVFLETSDKYSWYFLRKELPVGSMLSDTLLMQNLNIKNKIEFKVLPVFQLNTSKQKAKIGELNFKLDREADKEYFQVYLYDSQDSCVLVNYCNFFYNQQGKIVSYRFKLPGNDTYKLQLTLSRVKKPIEISDIRFLTYKKQK